MVRGNCLMLTGGIKIPVNVLLSEFCCNEVCLASTYFLQQGRDRRCGITAAEGGLFIAVTEIPSSLLLEPTEEGELWNALSSRLGCPSVGRE
ncbi:hypothetical protein HAX54_042784, partial [Datura stramonium]|nr:hypothetical protein [Datura stramonium]